MTEADWLACADPGPMLEYLEGRASERKLRLFAVACCRGIWHLLADEGSRHAVDVAERLADGQRTPQDLGESAAGRVGYVQVGRRSLTGWQTAGYGVFVEPAARSAVLSPAILAASQTVTSTVQTVRIAAWEPLIVGVDAPDFEHAAVAAATAEEAERCKQSALLRGIFGNPFRPVALDPAWLTPTVTSLARTIYHDRAFDRLPILADALEEAGCDNADILAHCRGPGPHARGCWPVDLLLGKT